MYLTSRKAGRRKLNIVRSAVNSTLTGMAVQAVHKAWDALVKPSLLWPPLVVIQPYLICIPAVIPFQVLMRSSDGFLSQKEQKMVFEGGLPL